MHLLLASLLPLVLGPVLVWGLQHAKWAARALDAFVLISVAGLVLLSILPDALVSAGWAAVIAIVAGTVLPIIGGKIFSENLNSFRSTTLLVGLVGLALHATLDGVALAAHGHGHGSALAFAVVLHRLPVGLAIWWLVRPRLGVRVAIGSVALIAMSSAAGFFWAHDACDWMHGQALGIFQALVAGSLLHVAAGHSVAPEKPNPHVRWKVASAVGGLLAAATVALLAHLHPLHRSSPEALTFEQTLFRLSVQSAPALLVAFSTASVVHLLVPVRFGSWTQGGNWMTQAFRGVGVSVPTHTCSCEINPRYESLIQGKVSPLAAITFLVATSEIGVVSVSLSFALLGANLATARIASTLLLAIGVAALLGRSLTQMQIKSPPLPPQPKPALPIGIRLRGALRYGFVEIPDRILPWFVTGLLAAALFEPMVAPRYMHLLPWWLEVPVVATIGMPLYLCASGSTPLAAVLIHKGLSAGAVVSLLLTGPAVNLTTFTLLCKLHGRKVAVAFGLVLASIAISLGVAINALFPKATISLHDLPQLGQLSKICLAGVCTVLLTSWFRQGAHGFVSRVVQLHGHFHSHGSDASSAPKRTAAECMESRHEQ